MLAVLKPVYGLMQGIPTDHPLFSTYWRKRTPPPAAMDPDRDGCGLLWCSPVAPNDGVSAGELTRLATELLLRHGFEPAISITVLNERTISCVIALAYDRQVQGEDDRARACYDQDLLAATGEKWLSFVSFGRRGDGSNGRSTVHLLPHTPRSQGFTGSQRHSLPRPVHPRRRRQRVFNSTNLETVCCRDVNCRLLGLPAPGNTSWLRSKPAPRFADRALQPQRIPMQYDQRFARILNESQPPEICHVAGNYFA